MINEIIRQ